MRRSVFAVACCSFLVAAPARAQLSGFGDVVTRSDILYLAGETRQAWDLLTTRLASDSTDYEVLWRAARAGVVIGIEEEGSRQQNLWLDPALDFSTRALALRPDGIDALYWHGVSAGRRAMNASPSYAVGLAEMVYDDAHAILAADSLHGGAHNMLGKLNYEIMSLSWFERTIAKTFMGNDALDDTSWENAERHLVRAAEVWPDFVLFHFDVGQLHRKRDRRDQAVDAFRQVLGLRAVHPTDQRLQEEAREVLLEWEVDLELPEPASEQVPDSVPVTPADSGSVGR